MSDGHIIIIAEAGVNHNGSLDMAMQLVDAAAAAGADVVKFQSFNANQMVTASAPMALYQTRSLGSTESQVAMLRRLEMSEDSHKRLIAHCEQRNIRFLSSPFDIDSLSLLVDHFDLPEVKLGSGELTNAPLLLAAARSGRRIILSTGMSTLGEVEAALGVLAFGYTAEDGRPNREAFEKALGDPISRSMLCGKVVLLHCTSEYPAPIEDVNLRAMDSLRIAFGIPVGYSDHTRGIAISIAAAARGASIIEKHITLDRGLPGPDHAASLEPDDLNAMVKAIREVEIALGDGVKMPRASERGNMIAARKSIVAAKPIAAKEQLSAANMAVKRPGGGLSPMNWWDIEGSYARREYIKDEAIEQ